MKKALLLCFMGAATFATAFSQTDKPTYKTFKYEDGASLQRISDNGKWGAVCGQDNEGYNTQIIMRGARIVNLSTTAYVDLTTGLNTDTVKTIAVYDVTDDGNIGVGQVNNQAGYYNVSEQKWHILPSTGIGAQATSITPDGRYAVGICSPDANEYHEAPMLWDLQTGDSIHLNNLPKLDMSHSYQGQNRFIGIAADGKYILGCMSYSYLPAGSVPSTGGVCYYVYNRDTESYKMIGFTESDTEEWTPAVEHLFYVSEAGMSNNGRYVTGSCYIVEDATASSSKEYFCPFKYDVETGTFTAYDDSNSQDYSGYSVDNDGEVYAAGPESNPYRNFGVRSGNYWVDFAQGVKQQYNFDLLDRLGFDNSGTPIGVSDNSLTIGVIVGDGDNYVITLPENFATTATKTNLLSSYTISPKANTSFAKLTNLKLTFARSVQVLTQANVIKVLDEDNNEVCKAFSCTVSDSDPYTVNIVFRNANFSEPDANYKVVIPAKCISIKGDATRYNEEIRIVYQGRAAQPVQLIETSPKENAAIAKLDASTSPAIFNFDTSVQVASTSTRAQLYQTGISTPVAELLMAANGEKLYVYPSTQQNLYKDVAYKVVLPAGAVTDITGNQTSANEELTLNLRGAYERQISYDDNVLYSENFDNGLGNVMLYDGDTNVPDETSQGYNFNSPGNAYAWVPVRDDNATDGYSAASTSMYATPGTSDDWLVTPQINIMDKFCTLSFKSQSFYKGSTDSLKVVVWPSNTIYSTLNDDVVDLMKAEGTVVYNELQSPGASEGTLAGEWRENTIDLSEFAGKNVYIAFVNQNEDQSLVFIDDIVVNHNLSFYASFLNEESVVDQKSIDIKGSIQINDSTETFTDVMLTLRDGNGNEVDKITETGLSLKNKDTYAFAFSKPLPLTVGQVNKYSVDFKLNDKENSVSKAVSDLYFKPTKRVTLEEFTGMGCTNCPLGILGIDNLHTLYGELFIPMALHCYTGDQLGTGVSNYAAFLNLTAAPSGMIQRGDITYPVTQDKTTAAYSFRPSDNTTYSVTWASEVENQLATPAQAEITATATLSSSRSTIKVPCTVKYALDATDVNLKLFAVVLENNLSGYQSNGFSGISDPLMGDWGSGGKYGMTSVEPYIFDHVVRGYYGETFTGTPDLFPTDITAGKDYTTTLSVPVPDVVSNPENTEVVVMLFNGNTDKLINAYKATTSTADGIDNATADASADAAVLVLAQKGKVIVTSPLRMTAEVLSLDGRTLARATGSDALTLSPNARGVVIVKVATPNGTVVKKVIL